MILFLLPLLALVAAAFALILAAIVFAVTFKFLREPSPGANCYGAPSRTRGPIGAIGNGLAGYLDFRSRSNRWDFFIFAVFVGVLCIGVTGTVIIQWGVGVEYSPWEFLLLPIAPLALAVPSLAMAVRRLHDINRSGWWLLLLLVFGYFILLYWFVQPSQSGYVEAEVFA